MWEKIKKEYKEYYSDMTEGFELFTQIKNLFGLKPIYMEVYTDLNKYDLRIPFKILSHLLALVVTLLAVVIIPMIVITGITVMPIAVVITCFYDSIKPRLTKIFLKDKED